MRKVLIILNGLLVGFFLVAFAYTLIARDHLLGAAREFAAVKTGEYAAPMIDMVEEASESKMLKTVLNKDQEQALADEISNYRDDPAAYVADLTKRESTPKIKLPENKFTEKIIGWKEKVRAYFDEVVARILLDVRIFSGTNLVAGLIALILAIKTRDELTRPLVWLSGLLCAATLISIHGFIDSFSFFQYLIDWQMGWSYPAVVFLTYLYLIYKFYRFRGEIERAREKA
ncbi:MAG: hypothetical protein AAGI48_02845 [Verrucomicrobiota bacterium]